MRACNGCRKRKIKCDAATTNTWPCSACTRLKLVCVPPAIGQDGDFFVSGQDGTDANGYLDMATAQNPLPHSLSMPPDFIDGNPPTAANFGSFGSSTSIYSPYMQHSHDQSAIYDENTTPQIAVTHSYPQVFPHTADPSLMSSSGSAFGEQDVPSTAEDLSQALGELKIDESGIGMAQPMISFVHLPPIADTAFLLLYQRHTFGNNGKASMSPKPQHKKRPTRGYLLLVPVQDQRSEYHQSLCLPMKMSQSILRFSFLTFIHMCLLCIALTFINSGDTIGVQYLHYYLRLSSLVQDACRMIQRRELSG